MEAAGGWLFFSVCGQLFLLLSFFTHACGKTTQESLKRQGQNSGKICSFPTYALNRIEVTLRSI